jgi:hypothetical protein|tara:strand:+ start:1228 stop:2547 length:1320 start_codon:yes stop_codon:yes gene_type:complete
MKLINKITINTNPMNAVAVSRSFTVTGDPGARFSVSATNKDNYFYNFSEELNKDGGLITAVAFLPTPALLLNKTINESGVYKGVIQFPTITSSDEYNITFYADPNSETTFVEALSTNSIYSIPTIYKYKDTTLTFSLASAADLASDEVFNAFPSNITSKGFSSLVTNASNEKTFSINWPITLSGSNFAIIKQPSALDFEFTTTKITKTAGSSSKSLELTDITGLSVGMGVSGTGIAQGGEVSTITAINKGFLDVNNSSNLADVYSIPIEVKTINGVQTVVESTGGTVTLASNSTFVVDRVITFSGKGPEHSELFNKTVFNVSNFKFTIDPVTTTTTAAVAAGATVVPVTSTNGIKDDVSVVSGIGINSASTMTVTNISSLNLTVRALVAGDNEALESGQKVIFTGSSRSGLITGDVVIEDFGVNDLTLTLNLDNILTIE